MRWTSPAGERHRAAEYVAVSQRHKRHHRRQWREHKAMATTAIRANTARFASNISASSASIPTPSLFFRMGDFYEMFDEDAELAARELEMTLTRRDWGRGERTADGWRPSPCRRRLHRPADRQGLSRRRLRAGERSRALEGTGRARGDPRRHPRHHRRSRHAGRQTQQLPCRRRPQPRRRGHRLRRHHHRRIRLHPVRRRPARDRAASRSLRASNPPRC